jgi:hypothetical protein
VVPYLQMPCRNTVKVLMKISLIYLALLLVQFNTLQDKPVVLLQPHQNVIPSDLGGDLVELKNAPPQVQLPPLHLTDSHGRPWAIEVKNLGPGTVTVVGRPQFHVELAVGHSVGIKATNAGYSSGR